MSQLKHLLINSKLKVSLYCCLRANVHQSYGSTTKVIDLRSDTVTQPSPQMREVMAKAKVGDDVLGEDETVTELERRMCELTGKENGIFVASGTMANLLAIMVHCRERGSEVILGDKSHLFHREQANIAHVCGVQAFAIATRNDGTMCVSEMANCIRTQSDIHSPVTQLICLENTHMALGGVVLPVNFVQEVCSLAHSHHLPVHLDGARIFNASIASKIPPSRFLQNCSSASICLSKGLGAPVGSVLVGGKDFVDRARRLRKAVGGGWRQAGIIAAGGLYALDNNIQRLQCDHDNAQKFSEGIMSLSHPFASINPSQVQTNMVHLLLDKDILNANDVAKRLLKSSKQERDALGGVHIMIKVNAKSPNTLRIVFHLGVPVDVVEIAIKKFDFVLKEMFAKRK